VDVGKIIEAKELFDNFKKSGGVIDSSCCNAMIEGLSHTNEVIDAYAVFEEARSKKVLY